MIGHSGALSPSSAGTLDCSCRVDSIGLHIVPISGGQGSLGSWGKVLLTGAQSALLRLTWSEGVELPSDVATDITGGVLLVNDEAGRLLYLPYAGESIVAYDLRTGEPVASPIPLTRDPDRGMRSAVVKLVPGRGALHLTEATLMFLAEDCTLAWRRDGDFGGWGVEAVTLDQICLRAAHPTGSERRQVRSLADGSPPG